MNNLFWTLIIVFLWVGFLGVPILMLWFAVSFVMYVFSWIKEKLRPGSIGVRLLDSRQDNMLASFFVLAAGFVLCAVLLFFIDRLSQSIAFTFM